MKQELSDKSIISFLFLLLLVCCVYMVFFKGLFHAGLLSIPMLILFLGYDWVSKKD